MLPTPSFAPSPSPSLFFFLFFLFIPCLSQNNKIYTSCASRSCGNIPSDNTSYPFWFEGQSEYCGDPKFKLNCADDNSTATINILTERFGVKSIDPQRRTLTLVDEDLADPACQTPSSNTTIDTTAFYFTQQDLNLTLYYRCPEDVALDRRTFFPFPCAPNVVGTYAFFTLYSAPNSSFASCKVASITLSNSVESLLQTGTLLSAADVRSLFKDAVQKGFEVTWESLDMAWCISCKGSGGLCGYNPADTQQRVCLCPDQPHQDTCQGRRIKLGGSGNKNAKKIAIGASLGAAAGFVALFLILFFFLRRKRITSFSSDKPSRTISTDPYSQSELGKDVDTQLFSYKELQEATNDFDSSKELGDGGFGTVYQGKLKDGRAVAVKRLFENNYKRVEQFKNEIEILSRLRHPNLVTLYGCCSRHSRELLLVYEYVPNGTIADHLHGDFAKPSALGWSTRLGIALETADALAYLHKVEIIHRDVKTNNILLDKSFHVKVADFGLSRLFPLDVTHVSTAPQGTPGYVDPEYHRCYQLTYKSDVYSFGVVLIELISSMPAVDITRHHDEINLASLAINKIRSDSLHELVDSSLGFNSDFAARKMIAAVAELAFRCLQEEKEARPTMEEVSEVLREIETQQYKEEIIVEAVAPADEDALLKGRMPPSPDTVTAAWISRNTTPNTSG